SRGINLVKVAGKWAFRTAEDLSYLLERDAVEQRRLSKAGLETLAIIAYHHPVTRARIEEIRGGGGSPRTLGGLLEIGLGRAHGVAGARRGGRSLTALPSSSSITSVSIPSRISPASPSSRAPGCWTATCRPTSRCPNPPTLPP